MDLKPRHLNHKYLKGHFSISSFRSYFFYRKPSRFPKKLTKTPTFHEIQTLLEPTDLEIDIIPEPITPTPTAPKYFKISPLPPYFRSIYPKREQTYSMQHDCMLGPGVQRTIETTVKVPERIVKRVAVPGIKIPSTSPFSKTSSKNPVVLPTTYPKNPQFRLAVIDPMASFPCLTNQ